MHDRELELRPAVPIRRKPKPAHAAPQHGPATVSVVNQAVLDLQRSHGNRYTQHVIARALDSSVLSSIAHARGGGRPLDSLTRTRMEAAFGVDLSGVRAHTGPQAALLSRDLGARAFTTGQDIFFGHGEYDPGSTDGRELLAHELTHVVQQGRGASLAAGLSDPRDASELEADAIARNVVHADRRSGAPLVTQRAGAAVQRMSWSERNGLKEADYTNAVYNTKTNTGYYLFTIWHKSNRYYNIQVHWHPTTADHPQENWTVRWANEGYGNKPATEWMKNMVRQTSQGLTVAMASRSGGGEEYRAQFPSLSGE
jgi:uncharacterized protein DUF4157